jgi:hypothetical protein
MFGMEKYLFVDYLPGISENLRKSVEEVLHIIRHHFHLGNPVNVSHIIQLGFGRDFTYPTDICMQVMFILSSCGVYERQYSIIQGLNVDDARRDYDHPENDLYIPCPKDRLNYSTIICYNIGDGTQEFHTILHPQHNRYEARDLSFFKKTFSVTDKDYRPPFVELDYVYIPGYIPMVSDQKLKDYFDYPELLGPAQFDQYAYTDDTSERHIRPVSYCMTRQETLRREYLDIALNRRRHKEEKRMKKLKPG